MLWMTHRPHPHGRSATCIGRWLLLLAPSLLVGCGQPKKADSSAAKQPGEKTTGANQDPEASADGPEGSSKSKDDPNDSDAGESPGSDSGVTFDLGSVPENTTPSDEDDCDCEEHADLIYLWGGQGHLWRYNPVAPQDKAFEDLGDPGCEIPFGQHPFSMGVDRFARAWLTIRSSGTMFLADTKKSGDCKQQSHTPGTEGFKLFGMAFVEHPKDGRCDQLYMHSFDGEKITEGQGIGTLGVMDPDTLAIKKLGPIDFNGGELTGTADGRLFAFAGDPGRLLEYDPKTAKVVKEVSLGELDLSSSFAFAFWGGDFYFFTDSLGEIPITSKVTKLDYDGDGSVTTILQNAPVRVAGAGVSVCAPLEEPPPQ